MKQTAWLGPLVVLVVTSSCAKTFYQGDVRPESQAAIISSVDTEVDEIDGNDIQEIRGSGHARFVLAPGPHLIGFSVHKVTPGFFVTTTTRSNYQRVCLMARPGGHYFTLAMQDGQYWSPAIEEGDSDNATASMRRRVALDCAYERLFPNGVGQGTAKSSAPAVAVPAAAEPPAEETETPAAKAEESDDAPAPDAPPALDPQRPAGRMAAALWKRLPIWRPAARPMFDVLWNLGGGFGGDTLLTVNKSNGESEDIVAGTGWASSLGLMLTPLWVGGDAVGLGVGTELGVKLDSISGSNGSVSLTRFPASATAHALIRTADQWFVLLSGGIEKDLGVDLSGDGFGSDVNDLNEMTGKPGARFRLGMYWRESDVGSITFGIGYTNMKYAVGGGTVDASSFNLWLSVNAGYQTVGKRGGP